MSKKKFNFLINSLRFDDQTTRQERKSTSTLAPISNIWEMFVSNCVKSYKPCSYVTSDEDLVGFRGRCRFRIYMPNKPNKYGIKIVMVCDVVRKYVINASPYLGKSTATEAAPLADHYVTNLTRPIHGSNRNITMNNWFTSIPLATKLLDRRSLTVRKNKAGIPSDLLEQNNLVLLLSTMHFTGTINQETSKPEIFNKRSR